jgi:hypothetical protein
MYFAESFSITSAEDDDWFDRLLEVDTQLFVDPFLIFAETEGFWADGADLLAAHFQRGFEQLAGHQDSPESLQYQKTIDYMLFPEPSEFGLGFVSRGDRGAGTGEGFARRIVAAMATAIERGLQDMIRFEELGVLVPKIGRDRISDIACNVLKAKFIEYTQEICRRHGIEMSPAKVKNGAWDPIRKRWVVADVELPVNELSGDAILLTPKRFLRELPTLNSEDWWNYVEPTLRDDLNLAIGERLNKEAIVALAVRHPDLVRDWTTARANDAPEPYDVDKDPAGLHDWQRITRDVARELPLVIDEVTPANLSEFVKMVNEKFRHQVEQRRGWEMLRNDDTKSPKRELSIQLYYRGIVESYCDAYNVRVDREVDLGRGPIDFVFTSATERVLLEVKKINNGQFWNGLDHQLTSYMTSEKGCSSGWFLAIQLSSTKTELTRSAQLNARTRLAIDNSGFALKSMLVDARVKLSASNLDGGPDWADAPPDSEFDGEE